MEIVYAAHTRSGVFMLDQNGVCRWAVAQPGHTAEKVPERIVGAQYLATLDVGAEGALVDLPRIGCPMLFAATDESGRIRLVRTPPLLRFEDRRNGPMRRPLASKFDVDGAAEGGTSRKWDVEPATTPTPTPVSPDPPQAGRREYQMPRAYDEEATPISSYISELASQRQSSPPPESLPLPLMRQTSGVRSTTGSNPILPPPRTPLPPPARARIAARIPPAPSVPLSATGSGLRASPGAAAGGTARASTPGVQSIPVRTRSANMSLKKLARGK